MSDAWLGVIVLLAGVFLVAILIVFSTAVYDRMVLGRDPKPCWFHDWVELGLPDNSIGLLYLCRRCEYQKLFSIGGTSLVYKPGTWKLRWDETDHLDA